MSFLGGIAGSGETIGRVRITSGLNTIASNGVLGNPNDDLVVMDDFLYAEPGLARTVPEPSTLPLAAFGITVALMVGVCLVASVLALMRLRKLEPAMVFR